MKILVINAGSSSLKYQLVDMENEKVLAKGICERIGAHIVEGCQMPLIKGEGKAKFEIVGEIPTHIDAIKLVLDSLTCADNGVLENINQIDAVGHRVLHAGADFTGSIVVDAEKLEIMKGNIELGPLHMPANIAGIEACMHAMPGVPNVAVFDTAFHSTMPDYAALYALPYEAYTDWKIKKYGFHGTSHKYVSGEVAKILGKDIKDLKIVTAHLGNGSSLAAVKDGKCIDTTMGLTPLEGVPMGTRSGDIDPATIEFLMTKSGMDIHQTINYLNKECGMLGVSGKSSDFRDLGAGYYEGDYRCTLALNMFNYKVMKYIGSYAAAMGGMDVIVFTGGVGENDDLVRTGVCKPLEFMGVKIDEEINAKFTRGAIYKVGPTFISTPDSKVKVIILPTNEELVIARETKELCF